MDRILEELWPLILVVRDWGALVFAVIAAFAALATRRTLVRQMQVYADGQADPISERTRRITLRIRNHTLRPVRLRQVAVVKPTPAVLGMDGRDAQSGPMPLHHVFPPMDRGVLVLLVGARAPIDRAIALKLTYTHGRRRWPTRTLRVQIDPDARLAALDGHDVVSLEDMAEGPAAGAYRGGDTAADQRPGRLSTTATVDRGGAGPQSAVSAPRAPMAKRP